MGSVNKVILNGNLGADAGAEVHAVQPPAVQYPRSPTTDVYKDKAAGREAGEDRMAPGHRVG